MWPQSIEFTATAVLCPFLEKKNRVREFKILLDCERSRYHIQSLVVIRTHRAMLKCRTLIFDWSCNMKRDQDAVSNQQ